MVIPRSDFRVGNDSLPIDYLRVDQDKIKWIADRFNSAWGRLPELARFCLSSIGGPKQFPRTAFVRQSLKNIILTFFFMLKSGVRQSVTRD